METASCAMLFHQPNRPWECRIARHTVLVLDACDRDDAAVDRRAADVFHEVPDPVGHLQGRDAAVRLAALVIIGIEQRDREYARGLPGAVRAALDGFRGVVPVRAGVLGNQLLDTVNRRAFLRAW